ncbi:hypothetical protein GCM10022213_03250 [Parerythrobacter jejuensis]
MRKDHVAAQPAAIKALLFNRPPAPLLDLLAENATIALYPAIGSEAPTSSYAKFFLERGHVIALPRFADENAQMEFAAFQDPFDKSDLVPGPFGLEQPDASLPVIEPDVLFVPLIGCTAKGDRLGQGGGHYDRWFAAHTGKTKVGLAWDVQVVEGLPIEAHDQQLDFIVTPTRLYGPFA